MNVVSTALLGLNAIIAVLIGVLLPGVQQVRPLAVELSHTSGMASLGNQIVTFCDDAESSAKSFLLSLADDADQATGETAGVPYDSLAFFCDADSKLATLAGEIEALVNNRRLPVVQRQRLSQIQGALEGSLVPAVNKISELMRDKTDVCSTAAN